MVPLAPHLRLVEDDASYISLQGIYEDHCRKVGMSKDEPVLFAMKKVITALETGSKPLDPNIKLEIFYAIQREKVPSSLALSVSSHYLFYLFSFPFCPLLCANRNLVFTSVIPVFHGILPLPSTVYLPVCRIDLLDLHYVHGHTISTQNVYCSRNRKCMGDRPCSCVGIQQPRIP